MQSRDATQKLLADRKISRVDSRRKDDCKCGYATFVEMKILIIRPLRG